MMGYENLIWEMPVVLYLFLAGVGAGALVTSGSVLGRGPTGHFGANYRQVARIAAYIAPFPLIIGTAALVYELGSFQAGNYFRFMNLYGVMNLSPMSVGTWLLTLTIPLSIVYAGTFLRWDIAGAGDASRLERLVARLAPWLRRGEPYRERAQRILAYAVVPLGIGTGIYTGVLLGAMPSQPFWNTPILALLFLVSAISTGVAATLLTRALLEIFGKEQDQESAGADDRETANYLLSATDTAFIGLELVAVFLFLMYAHLTVGQVEQAVAVVLPGGELAGVFWIGFILLGLLVPLAVELYYVLPTLLHGRRYAAPPAADVAVCALVLVGGFVLRYVVLLAGQITGPIGI